jgi:hypothetical protein
MNETMEVMSNELDEVIEVAESITPKTNYGLKIVGGATAALAVGYMAYKGVTWAVGKIKAKKAKDEAADTEETQDQADE